MTFALFAISVVLVAILTLVSYTTRLYSEAGKFLSREFQDNIEVFEKEIEPRLGVNRQRAFTAMAMLEQVCIAAISFIVAFETFRDGLWNAAELTQAIIILLLVIVIFHRFLPFVFFSRTKGRWLVHLTPILRGLLYLCMPLTLALGFLQSIVSLTKENIAEEPEHPSEAVDALIEAGQDEGILEESDRELIHSVVEFGDKVVREVMTPRPEMVAVPLDTTVEGLTDIVREHAYSRIPVYEGDIDHIKGIIFARDLLQVPDTEAHERTARELLKNDLLFVPETKRGSELLREMQRENIRMAIVIDEYGGVAGLVTIEDLIEEIVGELRDEDEEKSDVIRESANVYVVPGNMDVDRLADLFGVHVDDWESTTIAGLVSEVMGRIPRPGEVAESDGLRFEVLESTSRRVEKVRITALDAPQLRPAENRNHKNGE
ncbi:MAG TPA: hemolysin family protein [Clostridia bacterium]|nr:hemolysin family protein [Clostridia bacterium]